MKAWGIFLLYILAIVSMLCGCRQTQYVPVVTILHDSIYLTQMQRDSVIRYDSVYVRDRGDTLTVVRTRYVYRDRWRTDTLVSVRTDSIPVPYPVEKPLTKWERVKLEAGGVAIGGFVLALAAIIVWLVRKIRKK